MMEATKNEDLDFTELHETARRIKSIELRQATQYCVGAAEQLLSNLVRLQASGIGEAAMSEALLGNYKSFRTADRILNREVAFKGIAKTMSENDNALIGSISNELSRGFSRNVTPQLYRYFEFSIANSGVVGWLPTGVGRSIAAWLSERSMRHNSIQPIS